MKYVLPINGREVVISDEELIEIVKKQFKLECNLEEQQEKLPEGPKEGIPFEVNPCDINQSLFKEPRKDGEQEDVRKAINEAFIEVAKNSGKYWKPFRTLILDRTWLRIRKEDFSAIAKEVMNDGSSYMADWVHQALEWAQRIQNGETWEQVCNKPDTNKWFRAVIGREGDLYCVGGAQKSHKCIHSALSATSVWTMDPLETEYAVPLVILSK